MSCELVDDNGSCLCSNDHGDTEAERSSKDKISNGLKTLLDKVNSAREYIFVGSNVCKEDMEDPYTSYCLFVQFALVCLKVNIKSIREIWIMKHRLSKQLFVFFIFWGYFCIGP